MTRLQNTAETGLADGTVITVANSSDGSAGDAFASVTIGTGGALTYRTAAASRGALGIRAVAGNADTFVRLGTTSGPMAGWTMAVRHYFKIVTLPSTSQTIGRIINTSAAGVFQWRLSTTGTLQGLNSSSAVVGTASPALTIGTIYRVECWVTPSQTTSGQGRVEWRLFAGNDTTTPLATYSSTTTTMGILAPRAVNFGRSSVGSGAILELDDLAIDDGIGESFIGPAGEQFSGTVTVGSTVAGDMKAVAAMSGTVGAVTAQTGDFRALKTLAGTVVVASGASGNLTSAPITFAGTVAVNSGATGTMQSKAALSGTVPVASGASGTMAIRKALAGTVPAVTGVAGGFTVKAPMSGTVVVTSSVAGDFILPGLSGTVAVTSTVTGAMGAKLAMSGTVAVSSVASAAMGVRAQLAGQVVSTSAVSGAIATLRRALAGTVQIESDVSGSINLLATLEGVIEALSGASGEMGRNQPFEGVVSVVSNASGNFIVIGQTHVVVGDRTVVAIRYGDRPVVLVYRGTEVVWAPPA